MKTHKKVLLFLTPIILSSITTGCFESRSNDEIPKYDTEVKATHTKFWIGMNIKPIQIPNAKAPNKSINVRNVLINTAASYYESYFQDNMRNKTQVERDIIASRLKEITKNQDAFLQATQTFKTQFPEGISNEQSTEIEKMDAKALTDIILFQITYPLYTKSSEYMWDRQNKDSQPSYDFTRAVALDLIEKLNEIKNI